MRKYREQYANDFDSAWNKIAALASLEFHTITGLPFSYSLTGNVVRPSRAAQNLSRSDFEKAAPLMRVIKGPSAIRDLVRGSAYIFAILADPRVRTS